jgi:hypothetical protein
MRRPRHLIISDALESKGDSRDEHLHSQRRLGELLDEQCRLQASLWRMSLRRVWLPVSCAKLNTSVSLQ